MRDLTCNFRVSPDMRILNSRCPLIDVTLRSGLLFSIAQLKKYSRGSTRRSVPRTQSIRGNAGTSFPLPFDPFVNSVNSVIELLLDLA